MRSCFTRTIGIFTLACALGLSQTCTGPSNALSFTSTEQDQVRIPNPASGALDGFTNFTIECWVKTTTTGIGTLVSKWRQLSATQTPYMIRMSGGKIQVWFTNNFSVVGTVIINNNVWHHVAVTRTGSACQLIIDGVLDTAFVYAPVLGSMSGPVVFGCFLDVNDVPTAGTFYDGLIDEVRIWNTGRTAAQIMATMGQALPGTTPNLVGAWRLDEGSGQFVGDQSATAAHGYLGATNAIALNDPTWSVGSGPALFYPCTGPGGNVNSPLATLLVNGIGVPPGAGPFGAYLTPGGTITLTWAGPPGKPFALLVGTLNPANTTIPGVGIVDIGIPPTFSDIIFFLDGSQGPGAFFYTLGPGGIASQSFTLPPSLQPGPLLAIQGIVFQPPGTTPFGLVLTAAFLLIG